VGRAAAGRLESMSLGFTAAAAGGRILAAGEGFVVIVLVNSSLPGLSSSRIVQAAAAVGLAATRGATLGGHVACLLGGRVVRGGAVTNAGVSQEGIGGAGLGVAGGHGDICFWGDDDCGDTWAVAGLVVGAAEATETERSVDGGGALRADVEGGGALSVVAEGDLRLSSGPGNGADGC